MIISCCSASQWMKIIENALVEVDDQFSEDSIGGSCEITCHSPYPMRIICIPFIQRE